MRKITKLFHHSENTISTKAFLFCVTFNTKIVKREKQMESESVTFKWLENCGFYEIVNLLYLLG